GTIFASPSHPAGLTGGPQLIRTLKQANTAVPLLAIGGITSVNARQVMEAGADGIAVISAILDAADIKRAVQELRVAIDR
ncbi:MAG: thiamine phosphate synthase, partial [Ktedonobacteraceae bacterium]